MDREPRGHIADAVLLVVLAMLGVGVLVLGQRGALVRGRATQAEVVATSLATVISIGPTSPLDAPTAVMLPTRKPNETGVPTPFPTVLLPPMTPVPTNSGPEPTRTLPPEQPHPTLLPDAPFNQTIFAESFPNTTISVNDATFIVIGTVQDILPPRWSTVDGKRPANPRAEGSEDFIFRPVVLNVEQYLLGKETVQQLTLVAVGGTIGQDSVVYASDDLFAFQIGERVIVFGMRRADFPDGNVRLDVLERYTLTADGQATNSLRTLALSQSLDEIRAALVPTAVTTAVPVVATPQPQQ